MSAGRYVHVVWCDDIRLELGNKRSFMGVYGPVLFVPAFPHILPKLCAWITFRTPVDEQVQSLVFRILDGQSVLMESPMDEAFIAHATAQVKAAKSTDPGTQTLVGLEVQFMLAPFPVEEPKTLRVRVIANGQEMKGAQLEILQGSKENVPG